MSLHIPAKSIVDDHQRILVVSGTEYSQLGGRTRIRSSEGTIRGMGRRRRGCGSSTWRPFRSRCTAGRAMTSAASKTTGEDLGGGLAVTGHLPRQGPHRPMSCGPISTRRLALLPGSHRVNLHASYAETDGRKRSSATHSSRNTSRLDRLANPDGSAWTSTRRTSPTAGGRRLTLAHRDPAIRRFWIDHRIASRRIGGAIGKQLGTPCVTNVWIPDGSKDNPSTANARGNGSPMRSTRSSPSRSTHDTTATPSREALSHRLGNLRRRLARILLRLRLVAPEAVVPGCRSLSSDRGGRRQDLGGAHVPG